MRSPGDDASGVFAAEAKGKASIRIDRFAAGITDIVNIPQMKRRSRKTEGGRDEGWLAGEFISAVGRNELEPRRRVERCLALVVIPRGKQAQSPARRHSQALSPPSSHRPTRSLFQWWLINLSEPKHGFTKRT